MVATFGIEAMFVLYVFIRYHTSLFGKIAGLLLVLLATFQLVEYQICSGNNTFLWARLGFASITMLPVLGLHLVCLASKKTHLLQLGYALGLGYIFYYLFVPHAVAGPVCEGNYVILQRSQSLISEFFGVYYFVFLFIGVRILLIGIRLKTSKNSLLSWLLLSYLVFIVPTSIVYILSESARAAVPSIMCGFALFTAFIFVLKVVPKYHTRTSQP